MEHSLLHGAQLCALIFALGAALFRCLILKPILSANDSPEAFSLDTEIRQFGFYSALAGVPAALLDILVQIAELQNRTIYGPVDFPVLLRFISATTAGGLALIRVALLLLLAFLSRRPGAIAAWSACATGAAAVLAASLVSHAAASPNGRVLLLTNQFAHILLAAVWFGMLAAIFRITAASAKTPSAAVVRILARVVARFSPVAFGAAILLSASGIYAAVILIKSPLAVVISAYGLTLITKLALLSVVLFAGFRNWKVFRPALASAAGDSVNLVRNFKRMLELELTAGILVIAAAGTLGAIAPPGADDTVKLTPEQLAVMVRPTAPPVHIADPKSFVGALNRNEADLRYAEFTHRWSGVFVLVLGVCWLGQTATRKSELFARIWPLLLVPFALFVAIAADPEVWLLNSMTLAEALQNPQLLEHQIGALLLLILAGLGLRDRGRPVNERPLGGALPLLMIAGGLMLLGHAHSSLGISDALATQINVQHSVFGALALLGGAFRWFQHRELLRHRSLHFLWPGCVILLGVFMAFFYRESHFSTVKTEPELQQTCLPEAPPGSAISAVSVSAGDRPGASGDIPAGAGR